MDLERVRADISRWGKIFTSRLLSGVEQRWAGEDPRSLAACIAAKEACIKAMTGRYEGFDWRDISLCDTEPRTQSDALRHAGEQLANAVGSPNARFYEVRLGYLALAAARLALDDRPRSPTIECVIAYTAQMVAAVVRLTADG